MRAGASLAFLVVLGCHPGSTPLAVSDDVADHGEAWPPPSGADAAAAETPGPDIGPIPPDVGISADGDAAEGSVVDGGSGEVSPLDASAPDTIDCADSPPQTPCAPGQACLDGACTATSEVRGFAVDGDGFPAPGVRVFVGEAAHGETTTDERGRYSLHVVAGAPAVLRFEDSPPRRFAAHLLWLPPATTPNAIDGSVVLRRVDAGDRAMHPGEAAERSQDVGFGGAIVGPTEPPGGERAWFGRLGGARPGGGLGLWEGPVETQLTLDAPRGATWRHALGRPDAVGVDGWPARVRPLARFEVRAFGVDDDGSASVPLTPLDAAQLLVRWDLDLGPAASLAACGGHPGWSTAPLWFLDESTGLWTELEASGEAWSAKLWDLPENQIATRYWSGTCTLRGTFPARYGWWAIGRRDDTQLACVQGEVRSALGLPVAGARVEVFDERGALLQRALTGLDGTYSAAGPLGELVRVVASRVVGDRRHVTESVSVEVAGLGPGCAAPPALLVGEACAGGMVRDGTGAPVVGVLVRSSCGGVAVTDLDGSWCLPVPAGLEAVISVDAPALGPFRVARTTPAEVASGDCSAGCDGSHVLEPSECATDVDCQMAQPVLADVEDVRSRCIREIGRCELRIADGAGPLLWLQRIVRAATVLLRRPDRLGAGGAPLGCALPAAQAATPVEGTCCSFGGLGGPDQNANERCDPDPDVWTTPEWSALGVTLAGEHRHVLAFEPFPVTQDAAPSFLAGATADADCDGLETRLSVFGVSEPSGAVCDMQPPELLALEPEAGPAASPLEPLVVALTATQRDGFAPPASMTSTNAYWDEVVPNLEVACAGAAAWFEANCAFPDLPEDSPHGPGAWVPVQGTCCGEGGLGGPDADYDGLCDPDPAGTASGPFAALGLTLDAPHAFVYRVERLGTAASPTLRFDGYSDLDCDGVQSTFRRWVHGAVTDDGCEATVVPGHYIEYEDE